LKKFFFTAAILLILILAAAVWQFSEFKKYSTRPIRPGGGETTVVIPTGQGFSATLKTLQDAGLVDDPFRFKLAARMQEADTRIKAGEYALSFELSPIQLLDILVRGKVRLHRLTIPEGYNLTQIAHEVEVAGFGAGENFMEAATDVRLVESMGIQAKTFEGYLFPDTYLFPRAASPIEIIQTMVDKFHSVFTTAWKEQATKLDMTVHETVTLASIIEKETGAAPERPLISSVFHNRLSRGMRLESDPTVIYGIADFDGNLTRKHLNTITPYNTYRIQGLPPGPIASPGREALEAALFPAETKYLFFVSKRDSTHQFSTNYRDHNRAVRKYQLRRR